MIRFGPSGIPLSCKGRTPRDGIEDVHNLGLNAIELQFVRVNVEERYAHENEFGLRRRDVQGQIIVDILREQAPEPPEPVAPPLKKAAKKGAKGRKGAKGKKAAPAKTAAEPASEGVAAHAPPAPPEAPAGPGGPSVRPVADEGAAIEPGDVLRVLHTSVGTDYADLADTGSLARDLDVHLTIHAPYYMDLLGDEYVSTRSMDAIIYGGVVADALRAPMLVTHLGLYHAASREDSMHNVLAKLKEIEAGYVARKVKARLGLETSGKQMVFGQLEEVLSVCQKVKRCQPVLNFAHIHAREKGLLKRPEEFQEVFDRTKELIGTDVFYTQFSGVQHEGGNERRYTPIKKGDLRFEPLAECMLENDFDVTIISSSPLMEHDAMYMKVIYERLALRKEMKLTRGKAVLAH
ncbi:MAG TPA: TIM barrel protein [Candidatus Thermoplasmatota archaeon]